MCIGWIWTAGCDEMCLQPGLDLMRMKKNERGKQLEKGRNDYG